MTSPPATPPPHRSDRPHLVEALVAESATVVDLALLERLFLDLVEV